MSSSLLPSISVLLVGVGGVGRELIQQIHKSRAVHSSVYNVRFHVAALIDSSGFIALTDNNDDTALQQALQAKKSGTSFASLSGGRVGGVSEALSAVEPRSTIVVDCSATADTQGFIDALNKGASVVFANKKPLTGPLSSYTSLFSPSSRARVRHESTVGAGTPMVAALRRLVASGDVPTKVQGTFSGTLGFVMSGLESGKSYSSVIHEAVQLGYTEPDPRDDLGGVDVARKAVILARACGYSVEMGQVDIQPLFPPSFASLSIPQFLASLPQLDEEYAAKVAHAKARGETLRYTALIENGKISVGLKSLAKDSPIGRLMGTENMVEYTTNIYSKPLVIQGCGAGGAVTASGVLADMIELADIINSARAH